MKILLLGYMGSGKSSVGQCLAKVLQVPFYDLDKEIENKLATSVSEIFKNRGEIFFRKTEFETLQSLIEAKDSFVLALGGGTPCYGNVMQVLREREKLKTVFLQASVSELTDRLFPERQKRPLIAHLETKELLNDFIRKHIFERNFYYNQAGLTIKADAPLAHIVEEIVLQLF